MHIQAIKVVTVALAYEVNSLKPVIRHWIEELPVIEQLPATLTVGHGSKRSCISIRYHLHPLENSAERAGLGHPPGEFNREFGRAESKRFSPDQSERLLHYLLACCRVGYEQELLAKMLRELRQTLLNGASFRLNAVDALEEIQAGAAT